MFQGYMFSDTYASLSPVSQSSHRNKQNALNRRQLVPRYSLANS